MRRLLTLIATVLTLSSCIKNDIPYPVVEMEILSISAEGCAAEPEIDRANRKVTLTLAENTDIRNVKITEFVVSEGASLSRNMVGAFDMRYPQYVTLSLYQDYEWVITAKQTIDRQFTVIGQIGQTEWDLSRNIARAFRRADFGLDTVTVTSLRFGPQPEYNYPAASTLGNFDNAEHTQTATVEAFGRREIWRLIVEPKEVQVDITRAVAGAKVVWLKAIGIDGATTGFRYRVSGSSEWTELEDSWYSSRGGIIEATVRHLNPLTAYEIIGYAVSDKGEQLSNIITVNTTDTFELPNAQFNDWSVDGGSYYPYLSKQSAWWGTGNPGSAIAGINLTTPHTTDLAPGKSGTCAQLWSQQANVLGIKKFAAGNYFTGSFAGISGTNGVVHFGRPYTLRPTALRGWLKYNCGEIDCVPSNANPKIPGKGSPDRGSIYIALGDWDYTKFGGTATSPVAVDTANEASFFNSSNAGIIAYGEILYHESKDWYQFEIPLEYRDFDRTPTHIIIVATGSSYGDYFVGSSQSIMWLDDFELLYDYE